MSIEARATGKRYHLPGCGTFVTDEKPVEAVVVDVGAPDPVEEDGSTELTNVSSLGPGCSRQPGRLGPLKGGPSMVAFPRSGIMKGAQGGVGMTP